MYGLIQHYTLQTQFAPQKMGFPEAFVNQLMGIIVENIPVNASIPVQCKRRWNPISIPSQQLIIVVNTNL